MNSRHKAQEAVRKWNAQFKPGMVVVFEGEKHKTWGPAGLIGMGKEMEAGIFVEALEHPIPLARIDVPGYTRIMRG